MSRFFNGEQRAVIFAAADGKCQKCGCLLESGWHADHVQPWIRGGKTEVANGQALCPTCNLRKSSRGDAGDAFDGYRTLPMTLPALEARSLLGRLVEQAHHCDRSTVITKNGEARAVVVPLRYAQRLVGDHGDLVKAVAGFFEDWDRLDSWDEATTAVNKLRAAATAQSPTAEARPT